MYMYLFFFFLCLGSFSSACIYRYIHHKDLLWDRSRCPHCHHILAWWQLIPLFSYFFLKGRCYYCHKTISLFYPMNELIHIVLYVLLLCLVKDPISILLYGCYFTTCYILSWIDAKSMQVPSSLLLVLLWIIGFIQHPTLSSLLFSTFVFISFALFHYVFKNKFGFGDVLYISIQSLLFPPFYFSLSLFLSCLSALFYLLLKKRNQLQQPIPFIPFLTFGFILCLFLSFFLQ